MNAGREPTREDVAHALELLRTGSTDPDLWTRQQRAAVTRLHAFRDEPEWEPMCQCGGPKNHCVGPR